MRFSKFNIGRNPPSFLEPWRRWSKIRSLLGRWVLFRWLVFLTIPGSPSSLWFSLVCGYITLLLLVLEDSFLYHYEDIYPLSFHLRVHVFFLMMPEPWNVYVEFLSHSLMRTVVILAGRISAHQRRPCFESLANLKLSALSWSTSKIFSSENIRAKCRHTQQLLLGLFCF